MISRLLLALCFATLLSACSEGDANRKQGGGEVEAARTSESETTGRTDLPKVIVLGDSISAGLHLERPLEEAFPALLRADLAQKGLPFTLINAGVSGDTSAGGRARLSWMLKQEPDLLIVELGANDGLRGVELSSIEENLVAIAEGAHAAGVPVLLLAMRLPPNLGREYTEGFAEIYERVGQLPGVTLVPFFMKGVAGVPDLNHPDGIHPTAAGHRILADTVLPPLEHLLR